MSDSRGRDNDSGDSSERRASKAIAVIASPWVVLAVIIIALCVFYQYVQLLL